MKIAIPVVEGKLSAHFGHCEEFALVDADRESKTMGSTQMLAAPPHEPGLLPRWLAEQGAEMIIAGGMGLRPLMGFNQVGINVYFGGEARRVGDALNAFIEDKLPEFRQEHTCGGGGGRGGDRRGGRGGPRRDRGDRDGGNKDGGGEAHVPDFLKD